MTTRFVFLAGVACLAMPAVALAQDTGDTNVIVVTGRGLDETPATPAYDVVNIPSEQIVATGSGRIEDALSNVAGFQEFRRSDSRSSNPSAQGVALRALNGNATSRAQVLLVGVLLVVLLFGFFLLSLFLFVLFCFFRVTRGGGSGSFGSGALAGTSEMESADAQELGLFNGQALVNDRGETQVSGCFAPERGKGSAVGAGEWDRGQGFWTTPESQRVPASARARYDSWTAQARVVEPLGSDIELQARGMAFDDNRTLRFVGADSESKGEDASLRLVGRGDWKIDALVYGQWRNFSNFVISSISFKKTLDQRDTPSTGFGGKLEVRPPVGPDNVLRLGTDFRLSDGDLAEDTYSAGTQRKTGTHLAGGHNSDVGLVAEDDWTLGPVILTGGLRADRWSIRDGYYQALNATGTVTEDDTFNDRSGWETTWRAGALATVAKGVRLRAAAYTGLRLPTLNELYRPFVVFPVTTQANANLKNERLEGYEGGIELDPSDWASFSLTAFDNKLKNAISNVTIGANLKQRQNVDAIHAQGIELQASVRSGQFSLLGSLAYTDSTVEASGTQAQLDGLRPAQTPKWSTSATLAWTPKERMRFAATLRHTGAAFEDDLNSDVLPAATTRDLFAQVPVWKELSVVLRGENVFDATIVTRSQGGSMDYGTPATVWAGLRWGY